MNDPLRSAFLKVQRAEYHLNALDDEVRVFAYDDLERVRAENEPQSGEMGPQPFWFAKPLGRADPLAIEHGDVLQVRPQLPPRFGLILGDFLGNLRASLDHAVNGIADETAGNRVKFPIIAPGPKHRRQWRDGLDDLKGVPGPCIALIERMQPYHGHRRGDRLLLLANLCNLDKHHGLFPSTVLAYFGMAADPRTRGGGITQPLTGVLGDETTTHVTFVGPYAAPKVEGGPPYEIGFSDSPGGKPRVKRVDLTMLMQEVLGIIVEIGDAAEPTS